MPNSNAPSLWARVMSRLGLGQAAPALQARRVPIPAPVGYLSRADAAQALTVLAIVSCIRVIADRQMMLPARVERRAPGAHRATAEHAHAVTRLLNNPNPDMTPETFRWLMTALACLQGNAYAEIEYNLNEMPINLWPLAPEAVTLEYNQEGRVKAAINGKPIPYEHLLHIRGMSFRGLSGSEHIEMLSGPIRATLGMQARTDNFMERGTSGTPYVRDVHGKFTDPESVRNMLSSLNSRVGGANNFGRWGFIEQGLEAGEIKGANFRDQQFVELRSAVYREVCGFFGVAPHEVGESNETTFSNVDSMYRQQFNSHIGPWSIKFASECTRVLLSAQEKADGYLVNVPLNPLDMVDLQTRSEITLSMFEKGLIRANEARGYHNLEPFANDFRLTPLNMQITVEESEA